MRKQLENLWAKPMWTSHLGAIKGCADYLNLNVSDGWLFGTTGHAFILNIHEVVCASGPTAWCTEMIFKLAKNAGCTIDGVISFKQHKDFTDKQKIAWENTKQAIDNGFPCYGWELDIPEYYVVYGVDDIGYYFSGPLCIEGKGTKPWNKLGDSAVGVLEMYTVKPCKPSDDIHTVKDAIKSVLEHAKNPGKWIYPKYRAGLAGYDLWIKALETGTANDFGMPYNAEVWNECRKYAVEFLKEAKTRIGKIASLFDEAIDHYEVVSENMKKVVSVFPFLERNPNHIKDEGRVRTALESLRQARSAEEAGLITLGKILKEL
jgi:hypothetical protein